VRAPEKDTEQGRRGSSFKVLKRKVMFKRGRSGDINSMGRSGRGKKNQLELMIAHAKGGRQ